MMKSFSEQIGFLLQPPICCGKSGFGISNPIFPQDHTTFLMQVFDGPKMNSNGIMDELFFFVDLKVFDDVSGAPDRDVRDSSGHLPMSGVIWLTNTEWWKWWQNRPLLNWRPSPSSESHKRLSTCTLWSREDVKNKFSLDTSRCYAWHDYLTSYQMEKLVILLVRNIQRLLEKDQISPSTLQEHEDDSWHI